ncbi:MAG: N-acetylmuramoyl-L-alanine amidase [Acidobacteria bacterium]|nr:N-acetylmuramoyl-L-alanine amidase [Acidobacteriota bacterium]MBI3664548.1 N-acetylmuramoyl-L-alanine amidase [Acidobacteriota bacterium]
MANTIVPQGIIVHHSAVPTPATGDFSQYVEYLKRIHKARGFGVFYWGRIYYLGYHYVILPDGTISQGRPERARGAHAAAYNSYIGICLVGDFSSAQNPTGTMGLQEPTQAQIQSLVRLVRELRSRYAIPPERILLHRQVDRDTQCPGDRFPVAFFTARIQ